MHDSEMYQTHIIRNSRTSL